MIAAVKFELPPDTIMQTIVKLEKKRLMQPLIYA
jgi:hypothetical protein